MIKFQILLKRNRYNALHFHVCYLYCSIIQSNQLYGLSLKIDSVSYLKC